MTVGKPDFRAMERYELNLGETKSELNQNLGATLISDCLKNQRLSTDTRHLRMVIENLKIT